MQAMQDKLTREKELVEEQLKEEISRLNESIKELKEELQTRAEVKDDSSSDHYS